MAGERRLVVLRIDRVGDEARLGAIEFGLADALAAIAAETSAMAASIAAKPTPGKGEAQMLKRVSSTAVPPYQQPA